MIFFASRYGIGSVEDPPRLLDEPGGVRREAWAEPGVGGFGGLGGGGSDGGDAYFAV